MFTSEGVEMKSYRMTKPIAYFLLIILLSSLFLAASPVRKAFAGAITITTLTDEFTNNGNCSLREAITAANTDTAVDACPAGSGTDTINLLPGYIITDLTGIGEDSNMTGDYDITSNIIFKGAGMGSSIIFGNTLDRVFHIFPGGSAQFEDVTISYGDPGLGIAGGNILVYGGDLILINSQVRIAADGSGIYAVSGSTVTILNSRIETNTDSGLSLQLGSTTVIRNSTISGNIASPTSSGGGIQNSGTLTISNSTISGNFTDYDGGGMANWGIADLYNVTITKNHADADNNLFGNGGGIYNADAGILTVHNSIIAGNTDGSNPAYARLDCSGSLSSAGYNLIGNATGCTITGNTTGNITGVNAALGPLQDNGGPTFTHALFSISPAIDAGNPAGCTDENGGSLDTDQRGFARNGVCDMGAYEFNAIGAPTPSPIPPINVNTTTDELNSDGDCSLREAVVAANTDTAVDACSAGGGADIINLPAGTYLLTRPGNEDEASLGDLDITQDLTLIGSGPLQTTIDGNSIDRVFHILQNAAVQISGITITNGNSGLAAGGNILVYTGSLTLFRTRTMFGTGGYGIYSTPLATGVTIRDSRIEANTGGGLFVGMNSSAWVSSSTISGNISDPTTRGGGVNNEGTLTIVNSTISGNSSVNDGGGISNSGTLHLDNVTISNNTTDMDGNGHGDGGGVYSVSTSTMTARNTIIAGNLDLSPVDLSPDCAGWLTSESYNLVENDAGCTITGTTAGNIIGASAQLEPLQNNGGPSFTHALLPGSPAIDAGNPAGCTDQNGTLLATDQRGYVRNGRCDIGAYEYNSIGTPTPTNTPLPPTASPSPTATLPAPPSGTLYLPLVLHSSMPVIVAATSTPTATATAAAQTPTPNATATPTQNTPPPLPTPTALEGYGYVNIVDNEYQPAFITIHAGRIVTWENFGLSDHSVTSDTGVWDSGTIPPSGKFQYTFTTAGNYPYHCSFHPEMTGLIIVVP
jgi:CSLREA domain-containing protein